MRWHGFLRVHSEEGEDSCFRRLVLLLRVRVIESLILTLLPLALALALALALTLLGLVMHVNSIQFNSIQFNSIHSEECEEDGGVEGCGPFCSFFGSPWLCVCVVVLRSSCVPELVCVWCCCGAVFAEPVSFFWCGWCWSSEVGAAFVWAFRGKRVRLLFWFLELELFFPLVFFVLNLECCCHGCSAFRSLCSRSGGLLRVHIRPLIDLVLGFRFL
jgi:hypothetical protein